MTTDQRIELGMQYRSQGYNCAQSVLMAVSDRLGISPEIAASMCGGFGGGVGGQGEICGVASAMTIAESLMSGPDPRQKANVYHNVRQLCAEFRAHNGGLLCCRDLKAPPQRVPCDDLVADGIDILDRAITRRLK